MSNLVRQRGAHDLWISRSHLYAYGMAATFAVITAFAAGFVVGTRGAGAALPSQAAFSATVPDDGLIELLARVDAANTPDGGVRDLTFPDELRGEGAPVAIPAAPSEPIEAHVAGGDVELPPRGDLPPSGKFTLAVAFLPDAEAARELADSLVARELGAWVAPEQVDGTTLHRVGVGGWESRAEAEAALETMKALTVEHGAVKVVRY